MTTLKSPHAKKDQIKTERLIQVGKRLKEINNEIYEITVEVAIHTSFNNFSDSINELEQDIVKTLGNRQLEQTTEEKERQP